MANDVVGGVPVSLAYCTLCGAAIAYDGRASDGETYTFGSSGFLFRSNKLMYDRQTRTLWNQLTGEPVLGPLVGPGVRLDTAAGGADHLGSVADAAPRHRGAATSRPATTGPTSRARPMATISPPAETMFPVWQRSDLLPAKAQVYALRVDGVPKAYPIELLAEERVVNDALGETAVVLIAARGEITVVGEDLRSGPVS